MAEKKATTKKPAAKAAPKKTAAPAKSTLAFIFFNCDAKKSDGSMNVTYNREVYKDTKVSRKLLLAKVQEEVEAGNVQVGEDFKERVKNAILEGNPEEASNYMVYGAIKAVDLK